jgi:hypothetical protein
MSAPTEAEIRAALATAAAGEFHESEPPGGPLPAILRFLAVELSHPMSGPAWRALEATAEYSPDEADPGDLWTDLRRTEAQRLRDLLALAADRIAERCSAIFLEEFTSAGERFTAEYPDAPRAMVGTVAA